MAKLPDYTVLGSVRPAASSPDVRAPSQNFGILAEGDNIAAQGLKTVAQGIGEVGKGIGAYAVDQNEEMEFGVKKRLLDWKLQTEMDLERQKREMPVGGAGFTANWAQSFKDSAREFVGEKDANIPEPLQKKVGWLIKQHEAALSERAQRYEWGERDKANIEGLDESTKKVLSTVEADPSRKDEMHQQGMDLIMSAPIPPADRHRLAKKFAAEVDKTAAVSRLMSAKTKEDFEAITRDLAPNAPDKLTKGAPVGSGPLNQDYIEQIKKFEGFAGKATWDYKQHSVGYGTKARAPGEVIDKAEAEKRLNEELASAAAEVDKFAPGLPSGARAALVSLTFNSGSGWMNQGLGQAVKSGDMGAARERFLQYTKAGGSDLPGLVARRRAEAQWFNQNEPRSTAAPGETVEFSDTGGSPVPASQESYSGPYSNLSLAERRTLHGQAVQAWNKQVNELKSAIDKQASVAGEGIAPPQHVLDELDARVRAAKDPTLSAHYGVMLGKLQMTQNLQAAPPQAAEEVARKFEADAQANGATPDQMDLVKHVRKVADSVRKNVNENAVAWAAKTGITVPLADGPPADLEPGSRDKWQMPVKKVQLQQLDFRGDGIDGQLADRFETTKGIARYYGQPIQVFTAAERDALKDVLKVGGPVMLGIMGKIAGQAELAGVDPALVLKEITKDAPEVAHIGELVANKADPRLLETASKALSWKAQMGEKFESTIEKAAAKPDLAEYADVLSSTPGKVDNVKQLSNLIYEYEARANGEKQFNPTRYKDIVARVMGQTKDGQGNTYGGIGYYGGTFGLFGKSTLVPPGVRSDKFDILLDNLRANDLAKTGLPLGKNGEPLTIAEIRKADWVPVGPGQYWLQQSRSDNGSRALAVDGKGQPFVMDLRPLMGDLQKRKPSLFMGFDRMTQIEPPQPADPALPTFWTGNQDQQAASAAKPSTDRVRRETATRMFQAQDGAP